MVHSCAICNDLQEVGTAENILKAMRKYGAFWRYFKMCFGSQNCLENVESKEAKWCIRTFFEGVVDDFHGSY